MKKNFLIILCCFFINQLYSQQNQFFMDLEQKKLATFNDAISLVRLLFNERDDNCTYIDNLIWAAGKKLFTVTVPIKEDQLNPIIPRREFAYWICKLFNNKNGLIFDQQLTRYSAFKTCVALGIMDYGRGSADSFTGAELLDTFSYLDFYIKSNAIKPKKEIVEIYDDSYKNLPEWRIKLHKELLEQREKEKQLKEEKEKLQKEKTKKQVIKEKKPDDEKYIEKNIEEPKK